MSRQQIQRGSPEHGLYPQQLNCSRSMSTSSVEKYTSSLQMRRLARALADPHMPLLLGGRSLVYSSGEMRLTCRPAAQGSVDRKTDVAFLHRVKGS